MQENSTTALTVTLNAVSYITYGSPAMLRSVDYQPAHPLP